MSDKSQQHLMEVGGEMVDVSEVLKILERPEVYFGDWRATSGKVINALAVMLVLLSRAKNDDSDIVTRLEAAMRDHRATLMVNLREELDVINGTIEEYEEDPEVAERFANQIASARSTARSIEAFLKQVEAIEA